MANTIKTVMVLIRLPQSCCDSTRRQETCLSFQLVPVLPTICKGSGSQAAVDSSACTAGAAAGNWRRQTAATSHG